MKLLGRIFLVLGVFLVVSGIVYGIHSHDYQGLTLMLTTAGGALLFGGFLAQALQHGQATPATGSVHVEEGEPHVGPTIWPLVFALSMVPLVVGALGSRWVLVVGGVVFVVAGVGWLLDVQRQWQHHYSHGSAHALPRGPDTSEDG
jgi:hypothetical protein